MGSTHARATLCNVLHRYAPGCNVREPLRQAPVEQTEPTVTRRLSGCCFRLSRFDRAYGFSRFCGSLRFSKVVSRLQVEPELRAATKVALLAHRGIRAITTTL